MFPGQTNQQSQNIDKELSQIKELLNSNNSGIIIVPAKATPDAIAAATSLYMALTKMGKTLSLVSSSPVESDLTASDKFQQTLSTGGDNLVVSFPYVDGAIDKVDYNIEGNRFNLIIAPREGHDKLSTNDVKFSYTGGSVDFIITIDAPNLNSLGEIYQKNESSFHGRNIVNIDRHLINNSYGTINLVAKTSSSTSELVLQVIQSLKVDLDKDMATNLYAGIAAATNNFTSYSVNADTFEAIATLLRAGAQKKAPNQFGKQGFGAPQNRMGMSSMNPFGDMGDFSQPMNNIPMDFNQNQPMPQMGSINPQMNTPMPNNPPQVSNQMKQQKPSNQQKKNLVTVEQERQARETDNEVDENSDPETWLKPKIFNENDGLV